MKKMTCVEMGGPADCTAVITGNTAEEMAGNGMKHLAEAHPKMSEDAKAMTKEATDKWMADFQVKFAAAPDA